MSFTNIPSTDTSPETAAPASVLFEFVLPPLETVALAKFKSNWLFVFNSANVSLALITVSFVEPEPVFSLIVSKEAKACPPPIISNVETIEAVAIAF